MRRALAIWNRFWFEFEVGTAKLAVVRATFYAIVALDAWRRVTIASRYGAGDFNVSHLPMLDAWIPVPGEHAFLALQLAQVYLAVRIALGGAPRWAHGVLAALFGIAWGISQTDAYEHHYLVFLVLVLLAMIDWGAAARGERVLRSWPARLLLVQLSIVFLWTVIAKLHPMWMNGTLLAGYVNDPAIHAAVARAAALAGTTPKGIWALLSVGTIALEGFVVVALHHPRWRLAAWVAGASFAVGVTLAGLRIGYFQAYLMALYTLVLPDHWFDRARAAMAARVSWRLPAIPAAPAFLAALALPAAILAVPLPARATVPAVAGIALLAAAAVAPARDGRTGRTAAHLLACLLLLAFHAGTDHVRDYYGIRGDDRYRRGELAEAERAFRKVVELDPAHATGHVLLAQTLARLGRHEEALVSVDRALILAPADDAAWTKQAEILDALGRGPEALTAARQALSIAPGNAVAADIAARWAAPPGGPR